MNEKRELQSEVKENNPSLALNSNILVEPRERKFHFANRNFELNDRAEAVIERMMTEINKK